VRPYDLAIFDFDGTLADSAPWFRAIFNDIAEQHGFRKLSADELESLRGLPNSAIIRRMGVPAWKLPLIANTMRKLVTRDAHQITRFAGIDSLLAGLAETGVTIAIVTSNSEANVRLILGETNTRHITRYACGASLFGKAAKFRALLRALEIPAARAIAIGDEVRDIDAARAAGLAAGAVGWGYATGHILRAQQPDYFFERLEDIRQLLVTELTS
jgi:phosphoglycolate phosphatase